MSQVVRRALYSKLTGDTTLTALLSASTAIYHAVAPDTADYPFVIFNKQSGVPRYTFAAKAFDNELWLVKGVDRNSTANAADDIASRLDALLTDGALTISGETQMSLRRESDVEYTETEGDQTYRHAGALYRLRYQ